MGFVPDAQILDLRYCSFVGCELLVRPVLAVNE